MSFSVLMSLYAKEHPDFLRQSLESVFNQTRKPDEVVLVEDGPIGSELQDVLNFFKSRHKELKIVSLPINCGLGKALNEGLEHCTYELVARMDTDDIATPDRFEKQLEIFEKYSQVDVVSAWIKEFDSATGKIVAQRKLPQFSFEIFKYGKKRCPINHPAVMFRKNVIQFAGGYQPFPLFEDYFLWIRLLLNGAKLYNVQECLLNFRTSPDMYRRRGGIKHAINEVRFQYLIKKLGYISWRTFIMNISIRFTTRVVPNSLRVWIYQNLLRK